jgi:hypothetical protein
VAVVLHEQARFIGEHLFFVEGDQCTCCGATVSDEKLVILHVDVAMDGTHSHRLDCQVGCFLTVSEVKLLAQEDLNEYYDFELVLVQRVCLEDQVGLVVL